jgi:RHS repeat-associated protein
LNRGILNTAQNEITTVNHSESWNFDKTGNWSQYIKNGVTETRTHNAANELQGIATHDANGNMVLMSGLKGKYDAWNRLVEVKDSSDNLISTYEYNGLNQRIKKTVGSTVTKSFFNENWQEIESITNNQVTSYVWGLRYIDDLVLRERGEERLYSLADPNWNVVAICDASGDIQERYTYDAFGKRNVFDVDFIVKMETEFDWNRTFTGQVFDVETGLMLYRNRYYSTELGRFVSRDPIVYDGNDKNVYRYLQNVPIIMGDPLGLFAPGIDVSGMWPSSQPCCKKKKLIQKHGKPFETNGCTGVPDAPYHPNAYSFKSACDAHDICYEICGASKAGCDVSFLNDMLTICNSLSAGPLKSNCRSNAYIYYAAVYWIGRSAFNSAQSTEDGWCEEVCDD